MYGVRPRWWHRAGKLIANSVLRQREDGVCEPIDKSPCASPVDKFDAMQMCFASGSAEKEAVFEELVDETI